MFVIVIVLFFSIFMIPSYEVKDMKCVSISRCSLLFLISLVGSLYEREERSDPATHLGPANEKQTHFWFTVEALTSQSCQGSRSPGWNRSRGPDYGNISGKMFYLTRPVSSGWRSPWRWREHSGQWRTRDTQCTEPGRGQPGHPQCPQRWPRCY